MFHEFDILYMDSLSWIISYVLMHYMHLIFHMTLHAFYTSDVPYDIDATMHLMYQQLLCRCFNRFALIPSCILCFQYVFV